MSNEKKKTRFEFCWNEKKKRKMSNENKISIEIGDTVDLSDLLFTKKRNYLTNYKQNKNYKQNNQVKAKDLSGKVVVLLFITIGDNYPKWRTVVTHLFDMYTKLPAFEIVFIGVREYIYPKYYQCFGSTPYQMFLKMVSTMPWPAIPFSDLQSRKRLDTIFGISLHVDVNEMPRSFVIDPRGVILQSHATPLFLNYGPEAYPFTTQRLEFLDSQDNVARTHPPSMEKLLISPQRDYLINNKGEHVPLQNFNDKVVGLYFCPFLHRQTFTEKLKMVYQELSKNMENFEIVLIYAHGWFEHTYGNGRRTDEHSFMAEFGTMPWLALPFQDTDCSKKLQRIFQYPQELLGRKPDARLLIIGPHGKYIEPLGGNILLQYGVPAYPFTTFSAVNSELERVKKVKLEMFWDQDSLFTQLNGSQVRFSQLVGKRVIVLCQNALSNFNGMVRELKTRYVKMKGTDDEFEVIHIRCVNLCDRYAEAIPWLMHPPFDEDSCASKFKKLVFNNYHGLLAFDRDGSVMRKTPFPELGDNMVFPFFHGGDLENEVLMEVKKETEFRIKIRGY